MATETVRIIVTSTGAVTVQKEIASIGTSARTAASGVDFMRSALAGLTAYISAATFIEYSDAATRVSNSLKIAGLEGEAFLSIQKQLYQAAIDNGQATEDLANVYQGITAAQETLGFSAQETLEVTRGIAAAMRMSTAGTNAQAGALQQLGQLMGGTKVQAQEFNSLIDGARPLLMAAAAGSDRWGGSLAKLRNDVKNSDVTVQEFVTALQKGLPQIEAMAGRLPLTIGQAFVSLSQSFQQWIATSYEASKSAQVISIGLQQIGKNIHIIMPLVIGLGTAMAATFGARLLMSAVANVVQLSVALQRFGVILATQAIPSIVAVTARVAAMGAAFVLAIPGIVATTAAFIAGNAAFIATVAVIAAVAAGIVYLIDQLFNGGEAWKDFEAAASEAVDGIKKVFSTIGEFTSKGLDVTLQGEGAADKILDAFNGGGTDAANKVANALKSQTQTAAKTLSNGVVDGAKASAPVQLSTAEQASQIGKKTLDASFGVGADKVGTAIEQSSDVQKAKIEAAGNVLAAKFEGTGRNIYDLWNNWGNQFINSFGVTIGDLLVDFQMAQTKMLEAQAALLKAQAALTNEQYKVLRDTGQMPGTAGASSGGSSSSGGSGGDRTSGGSLSFGGDGGGNGGISTDSGINSDFMGGGNRKTGYRPGSNGGGNPGNVGSAARGPTTRPGGPTPLVNPGPGGERGDVINVFDLEGAVRAMGSKKGKDALVNVVKANPSEFAAALGIS